MAMRPGYGVPKGPRARAAQALIRHSVRRNLARERTRPQVATQAMGGTIAAKKPVPEKY